MRFTSTSSSFYISNWLQVTAVLVENGITQAQKEAEFEMKAMFAVSRLRRWCFHIRSGFLVSFLLFFLC